MFQCTVDTRTLKLNVSREEFEHYGFLTSAKSDCEFKSKKCLTQK